MQTPLPQRGRGQNNDKKEEMNKLSRLQIILGIRDPIKEEEVFYQEEVQKGNTKKFVLLNEQGTETETVKKPIKPEDFVINVMEKSQYLKNIKYFPKTGEYFLYNPNEGIYLLITPQEFSSLMGNLIMTSPLKGKVDSISYAERAIQTIKATDSAYLGVPELDWDYLVLSNGLLNVKTKEFKKYTPQVFQTSKVEYPYDPNAICPKFQKFLENISGGQEDRVKLLRS